MKKKILIAVISLMTTICLLTSSVLAWFVFTDGIDTIQMQLAKIDSWVTIYKGRDYNYDGNLDRDNDNAPMYNLLGQSAAVGSESVTLGLIMQLDDILPTQLHVFRLNVLNNSDARNTIRMSFEGYYVDSFVDDNDTPEDTSDDVYLYDGDDFDTFIDMLKILSVTVYVLENDGVSIASQCDKVFLGTMAFTVDEENANNRNSAIDIISDLWIDSALLSTNDNDADLLFAFEFEPLDVLTKTVENGGAGVTMTQAEYDSLQGRSFILPMLRIYLEIPG